MQVSPTIQITARYVPVAVLGVAVNLHSSMTGNLQNGEAYRTHPMNFYGIL